MSDGTDGNKPRPTLCSAVPCGVGSFTQWSQVAFRRTRAEHRDLQPGRVIWRYFEIFRIFRIVQIGLYGFVLLCFVMFCLWFQFVSHLSLHALTAIASLDTIACPWLGIYIKSSVGSRRRPWLPVAWQKLTESQSVTPLFMQNTDSSTIDLELL